MTVTKIIILSVVTVLALYQAFRYNSYLSTIQEHFAEVSLVDFIHKQKKINVAVAAVSLAVMCTAFIRVRDIFYSTTVVGCFWSMLLLCVTFGLKEQQLIKWSRFTLASLLMMWIKMFSVFLFVCV